MSHGADSFTTESVCKNQSFKSDIPGSNLEDRRHAVATGASMHRAFPATRFSIVDYTSSSGRGRDRPRRRSLRRDFSRNRRSFADRGTDVGRRVLAGVSVSASNSINRSVAARRLASCVRCFIETTRKTPSRLIRDARRRRMSRCCSGGRPSHALRSNSRVTRVDTLLTF